MKRFFFLLLIIFSIEIFPEANTKKVLLGSFRSLESRESKEIEELLNTELESILSKNGFSVQSNPGTLSQNLNFSKSNQFHYYIEGYYKRKPEEKNLSLYIQIYNPKEGTMIDALRNSNDLVETLGEEYSDIGKKFHEPESEVIEEISKMTLFSIVSNPGAIEIRENIYDNLLSQPIADQISFSIQKEDEQKKTKEIFQMIGNDSVVTASRKSQKISEAPAKIIVINSEKIKNRGYRTLTEVLQDVPYFDFNSFYDSGEYPTDMILRGVSDVGQTQVLIMEDGIIQNDIGNGWLRHLQFEYSLIDVERIEIILGPGSALYGSNAYAGLINIITKNARDTYGEGEKKKFKTDSLVSYGYGNTKMIDSYNSFRFENGLVFQLSGRYYDSKGDRGLNRSDPGNYFHNNYEPDKITTNEYGTIDNSRYPGNVRKKLNDGFDNSGKNIFLRGKVMYENFTLGFNYWEQNEGLSSYVPGYEYYTNTPGKRYKKDHRGNYLYAQYKKDLSSTLSVSSKLYTRQTGIYPDTGFIYTYRYRGIADPTKNGILLSPLPDKSKQYNGQSTLTGFQQQVNVRVSSSNEITTGFQLDRTTIQSISDDGGGVSLGKTQKTDSNVIISRYPDQTQTNAQVFYSNLFAFYLQDEQKFWKNYSITGGLRRDMDTNYGNVWTTRAGLVGNPVKKIFFKVLYGEAFKAPTVFQLYDEFRGNRFLKPQKIQTGEWEVSYMATDNLQFKGGYFLSLLRGQIAEANNPNDGRYVVGSAGQHSTYFQNLAPTHIYGYSAEIDYKLNSSISFYLNYTFTGDRDEKNLPIFFADSRGTITGITPNYDGKELDNIAAKKLNAGFNYLFLEKLNINVRMNWVGKRKAPLTNYYYSPYDYNFQNYPYVSEGKPDGYASPYTLYNLSLIWKNFLGIENLDPQLLVLNLLDNKFLGMGRQTGNAVRPISDLQPTIQNPSGFISPYHPQAGRQIYLQIRYSF
ncbi:MAG: TonB-dependent receptor [Leptospiraceae bacterium]|nr:TonB-dependent receptor [Leptospiraceae bacterium]